MSAFRHTVRVVYKRAGYEVDTKLLPRKENSILQPQPGTLHLEQSSSFKHRRSKIAEGLTKAHANSRKLNNCLTSFQGDLAWRKRGGKIGGKEARDFGSSLAGSSCHLPANKLICLLLIPVQGRVQRTSRNHPLYSATGAELRCLQPPTFQSKAGLKCRFHISRLFPLSSFQFVFVGSPAG